MKIGICAVSLVIAAMSSGTAVAQEASRHAVDTSCKMSFRVSELRTPYVPGQPLGVTPDDVYLDLLRVDNKAKPLCGLALGMDNIALSGMELRAADLSFERGDRFTATVMYQQLTQGLMLLDAWRYVVVIEEGANTHAVLSDLSMW